MTLNGLMAVIVHQHWRPLTSKWLDTPILSATKI